jgi:hypothetical protein
MENNESNNENRNRIENIREESDRVSLINMPVSTANARKPTKLQRNVPWFVIAISSLCLMVILYAFFVEARTNRETNSLEDIPPSPPRSLIQAEIDGLGWIDQNFLSINPYSRPGDLLDEITGIVIHNIGNPGTTAVQNRNYFENLATTQERHASSNFIICLDGSIIQCIPVDEIAYASNHRNDDTLSIEICHPDETGKFTDESYAAAVRLTAWLCLRFGLTADDVIRHYDVQGKECPRYFVENEDAWEVFKQDVARAMQTLRA